MRERTQHLSLPRSPGQAPRRGDVLRVGRWGRSSLAGPGLWRWAVLAAVCVLAGCVSAPRPGEPAVDLWPLLYVENNPETGERVVEALGPIFEWRRAGAKEELCVRPAFNSVVDGSKPHREDEYGWPFGFATRREDVDRFWLFPLLMIEKQKKGGDEGRSLFYLLPFVLYRSATVDKPRDLLILPFGGVVHDWYGRDRICMVLWPFYVHQEGKEAESWSVPWPLVDVVRWKDGGGGWKFWPFYGKNERPGRLRKVFVLWPFYISVWARDEAGHEVNRWMFWPFYGEIQDPGGGETAWVWPFFSHRVERAAGEDRWDCPWPFLGRVKGLEGAQVSGGRVWPLYVWETRGEAKSVQFLWPLGWADRQEPMDAKGQRRKSFQFVPFVFLAREEKGDKASGWVQIWPFYKWRRTQEGLEEHEVIAPWPERYRGGWERNWASFFRVYGATRTPEGKVSHRVLGRWLRIERGPEGAFFELKPFLRIHRAFQEDAKGGRVSRTSWRLLGGLLGEDREGGRREARLFWFFTVPLGSAGTVETETGPR